MHHSASSLVWPFHANTAHVPRAAIAAAMKETLTTCGLKMPQVAIPLRVTLLGQPQSPAIDAVLEVLGRNEVLARIDRYC